ncbi:MAG: hypothetical protein V1720_00710 [bacterium]
MICPKCEAEYVKGIATCADCEIELIPREEFERQLTKPSDWIIVSVCSEIYIADMLKANLEGAGIETVIISQKDSNFPSIGDFSVIKVMVKKVNADDAVKIIEDIDNPQLNIEDQIEE